MTHYATTGFGHENYGDGNQAFVSTSAVRCENSPLDPFVSIFALRKSYAADSAVSVDFTPEDAIKFATDILKSAQEAIAARK
jgi:hypothetical protein